MAFPWTRCRRCGRHLTNPASIRDGLGPECIGKPPHGRPLRGQLTQAIDSILDHHPEEGIRLVARQAAHRIEDGRRVSPSLQRFLFRNTPKETPTP